MTQMEFGITDPAQRRQLLEDLDLPQRNSTLLAAILWQFANWPNCYISQERLARRLKCGDRKTIGRAIATLEKLGIVAVTKSFESAANAVVNHYTIVWSELALIVQRQSTIGTSGCPNAQSTDGTSDCPEALVTDGTDSGDHWDSLAIPMGHIEGTIGTVSCPINKEEIEKQQTTELPVVVSLLDEFDLLDPHRTYSTARQSLGLTDEKILERIAEWRELPDNQRLPGTLCNWLTKPGSYNPKPVAAIRPRLNHHAIRKQRLENQRIAREDGLSLKDELLKLQEAQP